MRTKLIFFVVLLLLSTLGLGCDQLGGGNQTPPPAPAAAPTQPAVPGQPAAVPTQPGVATAQPTVPGQAAAGTPVAAAPPAPTGDLLTDKLNAKKFEIAATSVPTSALLKQILKKGTPHAYQVQLPGPPYCHTFVAAAEDAVKNIDLKLDAPTGTLAAEESDATSVAAIINHCPTVPGLHKLTVDIPGGEGPFAIQVFSK